MLNAAQMHSLRVRGIVVPEYSAWLDEAWRQDNRLALDAQPSLITSQNVGIPAFLANLLDPKSIRILVTPMRAADVYSEVKKGDWTTITTQFPMVESTGQVSSYNDYSNDGNTGSNYQWVPRQSYHYQTIVEYGDRETEMFGLAQINYVADKNYSATLIMNKFQNRSYLFGIDGMDNWGGLNDPSLISPIAPSTKGGGGTTWAAAIAVEIFNDIMLLYTQLQTQMQGWIDRDTPMTLAMSPIIEPNLGKVTQYTLASVRVAIKENWPNLKIKTIPEFNTASGEYMQLIADEFEGDRTAYAAFTEKLRAGRVIPELSSFRQKRLGGTWGTVIRRPLAIASMIGM